MLVALIILTETGCVQQVNNGAVRLLGFSTDEIVGQNISKFFAKAVASESHSEFMRRMDDRARDKLCESKMLKKDGSWIAVQLSLSQLESADRLLLNIVEKVTPDSVL